MTTPGARTLLSFLFPFALIAVGLSPSAAFEQQSCGTQDCRDCHFITREEAKTILGNTVDDVLSVDFSEVKGLWVLDIVKGKEKFPIYMDFSKGYILAGNLVKLKTMENLTGQRFVDLNRIDVSRIPLADALIIGKADAPRRIVVFEDPECPYCLKIYAEMQKVVKQRPDIVFLVKLLPLTIHPKAYDKAVSIVCAKSLAMLEESLNGKPVPAATCKTDVVDKTMALATQLGIASTPTLVFPDGKVIPGFNQAETIIRILDESVPDPGPPRK
jgi:thiol:disulfide interchange protein DsbC